MGRLGGPLVVERIREDGRVARWFIREDTERWRGKLGGSLVVERKLEDEWPIGCREDTGG